MMEGAMFLQKFVPTRATRRNIPEDCILHSYRGKDFSFYTDILFPSSLIPFTLMKEAIPSSETRFFEEPHGVTSQKTAFFIATAVKTSNLT
jgi:hypothetical protein